MQYAEFGIRILIGTVFLAAVIGKVAGRRSYAAFTASLGRLGVVPAAMTRAVALIVVAAEWLVCLLLLMPRADAVGAGLALAAVLLTGFAVTIVFALARGTREVCRCFGSASSSPLGVRHVVRNLLLGGLAACSAGTTLLTPTPSGHWAGLVVAALAGLLSGGCIAAVDSIVALFRPLAAPTPRT